MIHAAPAQISANQYVLHPIGSAQASEQTRASSEGYQNTNKSFDFVNNNQSVSLTLSFICGKLMLIEPFFVQKQLNSFKMKHITKRNSSGQVCNIENTNPNTITL